MSDRLALIIANSEFDDPRITRLATPSRDAEALARVLGDSAIGGFGVTLLVDQTLRVVRREIARLYQLHHFHRVQHRLQSRSNVLPVGLVSKRF